MISASSHPDEIDRELNRLRAELTAARAAIDGVDVCESHIRDNADADQLRNLLLGAGLQLAAERAKVERLRQALKPFATNEATDYQHYRWAEQAWKECQ